MRIAPFSTPGRFWRGNLHTHSNRSDGALTPEQVIDAYKRAGYDFIELSDHFLERQGIHSHRYSLGKSRGSLGPETGAMQGFLPNRGVSCHADLVYKS